MASRDLYVDKMPCMDSGTRSDVHSESICYPLVPKNDDAVRVSARWEWRALLEHTAKVAAPGADVLLCTNHRATSGRDLRSALDLAVGRKGWSFVDEPRLPPDFAMDPQFAKTLWVRFE